MAQNQGGWNGEEKPKGKGKPGAFLRQYGAYIIVILVAAIIAVTLGVLLTPSAAPVPTGTPTLPPRPPTITDGTVQFSPPTMTFVPSSTPRVTATPPMTPTFSPT